MQTINRPNKPFLDPNGDTHVTPQPETLQNYSRSVATALTEAGMPEIARLVEEITAIRTATAEQLKTLLGEPGEASQLDDHQLARMHALREPYYTIAGSTKISPSVELHALGQTPTLTFDTTWDNTGILGPKTTNRQQIILNREGSSLVEEGTRNGWLPGVSGTRRVGYQIPVTPLGEGRTRTTEIWGQEGSNPKQPLIIPPAVEGDISRLSFHQEKGPEVPLETITAHSALLLKLLEEFEERLRQATSEETITANTDSSLIFTAMGKISMPFD